MFDRPWRILVGLVGVLGIAIALFLLWRPSSDIRTLGLPNWVLFRWIDEHGVWRNAPSFAILAVPFLLLARGRRQRRIAILWLAVFVAATECGQLAISTRWFDLRDILVGWLGLAFSWGAMELVAWRQRVKYRHIRTDAGLPSPSMSKAKVAR
jgi:hypothetical protein